MNFASMMTYIGVMSITPGPNNLMSLYLGAKGGFRKSFRFISSSMVCLFIKTMLCGLLNVLLAETIPAVVPYLKWVGAAYMLYLAFTMVRSGIKSAEDQESSGEGTIRSAILLQLLNIKSWIAALSIFSVYVIPYTTAFSAIFFASFAFFLLAGIASILWCCCGVAIQKLFRKYRLPVSIVLALSLVYCAYTAIR